MICLTGINDFAQGTKYATAAKKKLHFAGHADAAFAFAKAACMKIFGECHVTGSHGSAQTAANRMDSATSKYRWLKHH
jgi:hypothetical protein